MEAREAADSFPVSGASSRHVEVVEASDILDAIRIRTVAFPAPKYLQSLTSAARFPPNAEHLCALCLNVRAHLQTLSYAFLSLLLRKLPSIEQALL